MAMNVQPPLVSASPRVDLMFAPPNRETGEIVVWWGLSVVERLSGDRSQVEWKLSAARFYNMGVKVTILVEVYGFARTTLKRFGDALRSGKQTVAEGRVLLAFLALVLRAELENRLCRAASPVSNGPSAHLANPPACGGGSTFSPRSSPCFFRRPCAGKRDAGALEAARWEQRRPLGSAREYLHYAGWLIMPDTAEATIDGESGDSHLPPAGIPA